MFSDASGLSVGRQKYLANDVMSCDFEPLCVFYRFHPNSRTISHASAAHTQSHLKRRLRPCHIGFIIHSRILASAWADDLRRNGLVVHLKLSQPVISIGPENKQAGQSQRKRVNPPAIVLDKSVHHWELGAPKNISLSANKLSSYTGSDKRDRRDSCQ